MARGRPSSVRSNFGQFQRYATVNLKKELRKKAEEIQINVREKIAEELEKKYKENVEASYSPRNGGSYRHTGTFLESIHTEIEHEPGIGRDRIKIVFDENKTYPKTYTLSRNKDGKKTWKTHEKTVRDVYEYLTEGTKGGGVYYYGSFLTGAINEPTLPHEFEQHTKIQMEGFLESLASDVKKGKYSK